MKRLVFYSDQIRGKSEKVDKELMKLFQKPRPKVGYVSSKTDSTRVWFENRKGYYRDMGIEDFTYFDFDEEYDEARLVELFSMDAIHLSGGNTFGFLELLKKRKVEDRFREYVQKGGILIGVSAGSIIMTEYIDIAGLMDENTNSLVDTWGLGLVDFEFFPHWKEGEFQDLLRSYSKKSKREIVLCSDEAGLIVDGEKIELIGELCQIQKWREV